jgi:hypothetical protein
MIEIKPPCITAPTDAGKIQQIQDYLLQLSRDLNLRFSEITEATEREKALKSKG